MSDEHRPDATVGDPDQWTAAGEDTLDGSAAVDGPGSSPTQENATQPVDPDRTVHGTGPADPDQTLRGVEQVNLDVPPYETGPVDFGKTARGSDVSESPDSRFAATASRPTIPGSAPVRTDDTGTMKIEPQSAFSGTQAYSQVEGAGRVPTTPFDHGEDTAHLGGQTPPPAGHGGGVVASSPSRRNRGKILAWTSATLALVLVIGLVGSELFFRNRAQSCMEKAFSDLTGSPTNVALSKKPVLLQAMSNEFPYVQVDTKNESGTGMTLHARAEGIQRSGDDTTIRSLDGTGSVPFDRVTELGEQAQDQNQSGGGGLLSAGEITKVSGNAADGTVSIEASVKALFLSIPVSTTIKPVVEDGKPHFEVQKANAFIFGVPSDFAQQIVDEVTTTMFGTFFDEVSIDNLKVTDTGVDFTVSGSDVKLIADNNTVAGNTVKCG
ncbi:hypothetical protein [Gordonia sp. (in: high G+C Gram-positive bacteria)]|jgi:hypothetical protein|uniref:hypothetical protein n=1 Tax=Gordonia sp. (in: high G+C Gram-positive bacteria) TaxID=84139 RepID=UPI001D543713|nr:hypothetical protein [Gordonia sp. (in: high G+C Gram-positive bacteria)]MCB1295337.1 hypothetical protein [Gordonia sp. (in: high G+C Gram-positive bacteria)]HMS74473.1 hypothetical protein [Gordonia sp. (in: high G+C Gram-positive bacteria)]